MTGRKKQLLLTIARAVDERGACRSIALLSPNYALIFTTLALAQLFSLVPYTYYTLVLGRRPNR